MVSVDHDSECVDTVAGERLPLLIDVEAEERAAG
jgi:hypothetical protein